MDRGNLLSKNKGGKKNQIAVNMTCNDLFQIRYGHTIMKPWQKLEGLCMSSVQA